MMLDWFYSKFMVTITVFIIIFSVFGITYIYQSNTLSTYALNTLSNTIAQKINSIESIQGNVTLNFYFNGSGTGINLPSTINGASYTILFTQNFVVLSIDNYFVKVSSSSLFSNEIHLYPQSELSQLSANNYAITLKELHALDSKYNILIFKSGTNFQVSQIPFIIDGKLIYETNLCLS